MEVRGKKKRIAYGILGDVPGHEGKVVLVLRREKEMWSLPGGHEGDDASLRDALVAQIQKETEFVIGTPSIDDVVLMHEEEENIATIFLVHYRGVAHGEEEIVREVRFFGEAEAAELLHRGELEKYQYRALTHYFHAARSP